MALQGAELEAAGVARSQTKSQDDFTSLVISAWNLMGGLEWAALPTVAAMLDIDDVELLIRGLVQVRDWQAQNRE